VADDPSVFQDDNSRANLFHDLEHVRAEDHHRTQAVPAKLQVKTTMAEPRCKLKADG
jgi:hypothetical protein